MTSTHPGAVLLLSFSQVRPGLPDRLRHMGFAVHTAEGIDEASRIVQRDDPAVGALLLPWPSRIAEPLQGIRLLRELAANRHLRFVLLGQCAPDERAALRQAAGAGHALQEPYTETELRFVVNYALYNARQGEARRAERVPTRMLSRVRAGTGEKEVLVYSLSVDGAFLETPRPSQPGSTIELELPLPSSTLRTRASVLSANVPGSAYRRHVPKGMGVRFETLAADERAQLGHYIEERARTFQI